MRSLGSIGYCALAALAVGCFNPHPVERGDLDASIGAPGDVGEAASLSYVSLTWQIARVIEAVPDRGGGGPNPELSFVPISPPPQVRIATLTGAFGGDATSYAADGKIAFPISYLDQAWRLEYTLADRIPHEVQWKPMAGRGHVTVPLFGRLEREAAPSGSGYDITPTGVVQLPYEFPSVLTTGLWTDGIADSAADLTVHYDFARAQSLSGPRGRPEGARGDVALFVDSFVDARDCRMARGAGSFAPDLPSSEHVAVSPAWDTRKVQVDSAKVTADDLDRLDVALGMLSSPDITGVSMIGPIPSTAMPGLSRSSAERLLPFPTMHALALCPYSVYPPADVLSPNALEKFPFAAHIQLATTRSVADLELSLSSGMSTVLVGTRQASMLHFEVNFTAAIPTQFVLMPGGLAAPAGGAIDLSGPADHVSIGAAAGPFTFSFTPESNPNASADYYDVVLHRIVSTALSTQLTTERIYTVTQPRVQIDSTVLAPSAEYVFEVRAYKGHPQANLGDFVPVSYPYGAAIVYTRTFKTS